MGLMPRAAMTVVGGASRVLAGDGFWSGPMGVVVTVVSRSSF